MRGSWSPGVDSYINSVRIIELNLENLYKSSFCLFTQFKKKRAKDKKGKDSIRKVTVRDPTVLNVSSYPNN